MKHRHIALALAGLLAFASSTAGPARSHRPGKVHGMKLVWSEEGAGDAGSAPNADLWGVRETDQWQPAGELQAYTRNAANAYYDGQGRLVIKAIKEAAPGGKTYTSARLSSRHAAQPQLWVHGLFEARIKVPDGVGIWPAWWLLGQDNLYGWPYCGEIDIMEAPASAATLGQIHQGTHSPHAATGADVGAGVAPSAGSWGADFHTYTVDWRHGSVEFYIDHRSTGKVTQAQVEAAGGVWVFDHRPQSPILNLAVGGWAGTPDPVWTSQTMLVDWVRIYQ